MTKTRVGVLRGGPSSEYEVSLKSGASVLSNLPERYEPKEIYVDKAGQWHLRGMPVEPARALSTVDVVFNALHGHYGEDGSVQRLLDTHNVPYTGSGALGSAVGMHKALAKEHLKGSGVLLAPHVVLSRDEASESRVLELFRTFPQPSVIKPVAGGSSLGVSVARSYAQFVDAIEHALGDVEHIIIEAYLPGREATVGVIEGFRGEQLYALPPIEIVPKERGFFDYDEKYAGLAEEICPARFGNDTNRELERLARTVHEVLGLRHYSRSDFIVTKNGVYFLEVNTLPGLTEASLVPKALGAVGATLPQFLEHIITLALRRI